MNNQESKDKKIILKMNDLYFSKFDFKNNRITGNNKLNVEYKVDYLTDKENDDIITAIIDTTISNNDIFLFLQTKGVFEIVDKSLDKSLKTSILKTNTIAIMFPYIRSQISLLTAQPGMTPILLQPINLNSLLKK